MGVVVWYLILASPFVVAFAGGYFLILLIAERITGRVMLHGSDVLVSLVGTSGIALALVFDGTTSFDRFSFVSPFVASLWQRAGYVLELGGVLFAALLSSSISAFILDRTGKARPCPWVMRAVASAVLSFMVFLWWPKLLSLFM